MNLWDVLKKNQKREIYHGTILEVENGQKRVKVVLDNGVIVYVRYGTSLSSPVVNDTIMVAGIRNKFIIQDAEGDLPKTSSILVI